MKMAHSPSALVLLAAISLVLDLSSTVSVEQLSPDPPSIMLMTGFDFAGTPSSTYTDPTEQGRANRKHPMPGATAHGPLAHDTETLSMVPREFRDKWDEIAGQETLVQLRLCLQTQRATETPRAEVTSSTQRALDTGIIGQLDQHQLQRERWIRAVSNKHKLLAQVPCRLYLANVSNLYLQNKEARKCRERVSRNRRHPTTANVRQASVLDEFVDFLGPELKSESINTRNQAKTKLLNLIQCGQRWDKLVERYGAGILLVIPSSITDDE